MQVLGSRSLEQAIWWLEHDIPRAWNKHHNHHHHYHHHHCCCCCCCCCCCWGCCWGCCRCCSCGHPTIAGKQRFANDGLNWGPGALKRKGLRPPQTSLGEGGSACCLFTPLSTPRERGFLFVLLRWLFVVVVDVLSHGPFPWDKMKLGAGLFLFLF